MLRKDKNGNETGFTGLKRNVQKEPPKKFYLKGEFINQSIKSSDTNKKKYTINHFGFFFQKFVKIFCHALFRAQLSGGRYTIVSSLAAVHIEGLIYMAWLKKHRKDASPTINGHEFVS